MCLQKYFVDNIDRISQQVSVKKKNMSSTTKINAKK